MRFPLVSRFAYDRLTDLCLDLTQQREAERAEVKRLTDLLFDMKRDGFNAPQPVVPQPPPTEPLAEPIRDALNYLAREGYSTDELGQEEAQARKLVAQGLDAETVASMLVQGDPSAAL